MTQVKPYGTPPPQKVLDKFASLFEQDVGSSEMAIDRETVIRLAREADKYADDHEYAPDDGDWDEIRDQRFAALVLEHGRDEDKVLMKKSLTVLDCISSALRQRLEAKK